MNKIKKSIEEIFNNLSEKDKSKYEIIIQNKYTQSTKTISYEGTPPKIKVYDILDGSRYKSFKKLEGVYDNIDHLEKTLDEIASKRNVRLHLSGNKIRLGYGKPKILGKFKTL